MPDNAPYEQEIPEAVAQARAIAQLPENLALIKMENDSIFSMAKAVPRDHQAIKQDIIDQLTAYPSFAQQAVYHKPVGTRPAKCNHCGAEIAVGKGQPQPTKCPGSNCQSTSITPGGMQYAVGLSIRAAEALAAAYGFNRVEAIETPIDNDAVSVKASFIDYQRGRIWTTTTIVSKMYRKRGGGMERIADDRFHNIVVKAAMSKAIREVIIRSVPPGLRSELLQLAKQKSLEMLDDETIKKIVDQFGAKGVTMQMLETHLGKTYVNWSTGDRQILVGVWTAVEDGETSIAEAFPQQKPTVENGGNGNGGGQTTGQSFQKPSGGAEERQERKPAQPKKRPWWRCKQCGDRYFEKILKCDCGGQKFDEGEFEAEADGPQRPVTPSTGSDAESSTADADASATPAAGEGKGVPADAKPPIEPGSQPPAFPTKKQYIGEADRLVRLGLSQFNINQRKQAVEYLNVFGDLWREVSGAEAPEPIASRTAEKPVTARAADEPLEPEPAAVPTEYQRLFKEIIAAETPHVLDHLRESIDSSFNEKLIDSDEAEELVNRITERRGKIKPVGGQPAPETFDEFEADIAKASKSQLKQLNGAANVALQAKTVNIDEFGKIMDLIATRSKAPK